jgi:membrane protease YdiL (CAAX protease family)
MTIPYQLLLFLIPSAVFILFQRFKKRTWDSISTDLGWKGTQLKYLAISLGVGLVPGLLSLVIPKILPKELLDQPGIAQSHYQGWTLSLGAFLLAFLREAFYTALGEEIFFRGFLGRYLFRKLDFPAGNTIQAVIFLLPHLLLLTISRQLWPILIPQFIAGWIYGWLCYRSDSILPGWLAHSLSNAFGALIFMG